MQRHGQEVIALVQQPEEASYAGMAVSAIRNAEVDYVGPARELGASLDGLARGHPRSAPFDSPAHEAGPGGPLEALPRERRSG